MGDETIEFGEGAGIEQQVETLAGGELSLLVLLRDAVGAAAQLGLGLAVVQIFEALVAGGHVREV